MFAELVLDENAPPAVSSLCYAPIFKNKAFGGLELAGSYLSDPQHPMYFYLCPEAYEFRYLVSDGEDLYIERYTPEETRPISAFIAEFIDSITGMGLLDLYKEKWEAK